MKTKSFDLTNDWRLDNALGVIAAAALAAGEAALLAFFFVLSILGIEMVSFRGLVWGAVGVSFLVAAVGGWLL